MGGASQAGRLVRRRPFPVQICASSVWNDRGRIKATGRKARRLAVERFAHDRLAPKIDAVIAEVHAAARHRP